MKDEVLTSRRYKGSSQQNMDSIKNQSINSLTEVNQTSKG